jgi:hypothetical protein
MTRQRFDDSVDHGQQALIPDRSLLCRMPGCNSRWTVDIGHGRVCSKHDEALSRAGSKGGGITTAPASIKRLQDALPRHAPVRPFAEPADHDEDYVHDDALPL